MNTYRFQRIAVLAVICASVLLFAGGAAAHDATPPAQPITNEVLAKGLPSDAPGYALQLERYTFAAGAEIPTHIHPGAYAIYVESGQFGFTVVKGEAQLLRAGSTTPETIGVGAEVVAMPGDSIFENGGVVHSARNAGDSECVVLTAALVLADEPSLQPTNNDGTPVS